jgi:CPA1 family monovalent cation:H+ antiporter
MFHFIEYTLSSVMLWRTLLIILVIASLARHFNIPYEVGLVAAGIIATFFAPESLPLVAPNVFLDLLLPPMIFHTALHLDVRSVLSDAKFMYGYALIGTVSSAALMAIIGRILLGLDLRSAILLGIIISPTDPVAVVSIMSRIGTPDRLVRIIEGEALFNDGAAIAVFTVISSSSAGNINLLGAFYEVVISLAIGHLVGFAVGYATSKIAKRITKDVLVQTVLSFFALYTSYELASIVGEGGIIGSAVVGLIIGNLHLNRATNAAYETIDNNWEFIDFLITSFSFVLIGSLLNTRNLFNSIFIALIAFIAILVTRTAIIFGLTNLLNFSENRVSGKWQLIISLAGLRGIVSIMLALTLSLGPSSGLIDIVFGIVLFSLVFQGLTIGRLIPYILKKQSTKSG